DLGGDSRRAIDGLREDVEKMTGEAADLRARIVQLEARLQENKKRVDKKSRKKAAKRGHK
ncbi:MAG: hypothetical protein ACRELY_10220, partial [Polyangiaceae bacterium]